MVDQSSPYIFTKRGIYYFSRRVPVDLRCHYRQPRVVISLRTRSLKAAHARAASLATKLDEDWLTLRWRSSSDPFSRFLMGQREPEAFTSSAPLLSEAKDLYLSVKGAGRPKSFEQSADRAVGYMINLFGDRPIDTYTRPEVNQLRDALADRGLKRVSLKRNFSVIRAMVNFATREHGLPDVTTFSGIYLGEEQETKADKRSPVPLEDIRRIQRMCRDMASEATGGLIIRPEVAQS